MLQDIKQHIDLVDGSIAWAKEFGKESFPYDVFKEYRRKLKRIYAALEENCSAAAYGESQVGKSYLMSIIAKTICTNFQNEMCIFPHFFAVRLPAWNII